MLMDELGKALTCGTSRGGIISLPSIFPESYIKLGETLEIFHYYAAAMLSPKEFVLFSLCNL